MPRSGAAAFDAQRRGRFYRAAQEKGQPRSYGVRLIVPYVPKSARTCRVALPIIFNE
jgi:hypothetical protein